MNTFWENISKFPKFLISVILGFFLTTLSPIFELLTGKKNKTFFIILIFSLLTVLYYTLRLMLELN